MTEITPEKVAATPPTPENVAEMLTSADNDYHDGNYWHPSIGAAGNVVHIDITAYSEDGDKLPEQHFRAVVVEGETVPDLAEVDRLRAKLDAPCGSCHPCTNYADETWRAAGRTPPHVYQWDETRAEVDRLKARLEAAEYTMRKALAEVEHEEVVHLLNRYFAAAEAAQAEQNGGQADG